MAEMAVEVGMLSKNSVLPSRSGCTCKHTPYVACMHAHLAHGVLKLAATDAHADIQRLAALCNRACLHACSKISRMQCKARQSKVKHDADLGLVEELVPALCQQVVQRLVQLREVVSQRHEC